MTPSIASTASPRHERLPDLADRMAKAALGDVRKADLNGWRERVGRAIERCRMLSGFSLKEFAGAVDRNERQVARWISGEDRPQFDLIFAVERLQRPLVIALAELIAGEAVEVETTVRIRRVV